MRIEFQIEGRGVSLLRELARSRVPEARRRMVVQGMQATLERTMALNPVDTGRSRAAWQAALAQLQGGNTSGGGGGPVAEGAALGWAAQEHGERTSEVSATNGVSYVPFLEYGTSRMAPFQMVRRSLAVVRGMIAAWFRLE